MPTPVQQDHHSALLLFMILALVLFPIDPVRADVYTWEDEDGTIHFSATPPDGRASPAEVVPAAATEATEIGETYHGTKPSRVVRLVAVTLDLPVDASTAPIGYTGRGQECEVSHHETNQLRMRQGRSEKLAKGLGNELHSQLESMGYRAPPALQPAFDVDGPTTDLGLYATIIAMDRRSCRISEATRGRSLQSTDLEVVWTLIDHHTQRPVLELRTTGASDTGIHPRDRKERFVNKVVAYGARRTIDTRPDEPDTSYASIIAALSDALDPLIAHDDFRSLLDPRPATVSRAEVARKPWVSLELVVGGGASTLQAGLGRAKQATATVSRPQSVSTAILIAPTHLLAPAETIREKTFKVRVGGEAHRAVAVRLDPVRGLALLRLDRATSSAPMPISQSLVTSGDTVHALSLDAKQRHVNVSPGIVSAVRSIDGARYLQTDASRQRSGRGGPVLNESGELVGVMLDGLESRNGRDKGINYFVPIAEVLAALGVEAR